MDDPCTTTTTTTTSRSSSRRSSRSSREIAESLQCRRPNAAAEVQNRPPARWRVSLPGGRRGFRGLGFRVQGFGVQGFGVQGLGFRV